MIKHAFSGLRMFPLIVLLGATGCHGSNTGWNGTWKLNPAKSSVVGGAYITISTSSDGGIRLTNDAFSFDFRCDGKDYPNPNGRDLTTSCTSVGTGHWDLTYKRNGTVWSEAAWDFSQDDATLAIHSKSMQPNGTFKAFEHVYKRSGSGTGIAGRWQETDSMDSGPKFLTLSLQGSQIHFAYPDIGQFADAPLDGTKAPWHAPRAKPGFSISMKREGPQQFHREISFEDRVIREGTMKLSEDGRTIVFESWIPGHSNERDSFVYEKQ